MHSGLQTSASPPRRGATRREKYEQSQEREQASERASERTNEGWKTEGAGTQKGCDGRAGGYPTRYLNLRLPRGRAQKCKAIVSQPRPVSSSAALFSTLAPSLLPVRKGVTYRDTRESAEGLGISLGGPLPLLLPGFGLDLQHENARLTEFPWKSRCLFPLSLSFSFLFLARSLRCVCVYSVYLADPQRSSSFTGEADQSASRGFTVRGIRTTLVRLRALLPATRRVLVLLPSTGSRVCRYFSSSGLEARGM